MLKVRLSGFKHHGPWTSQKMIIFHCSGSLTINSITTPLINKFRCLMVREEVLVSINLIWRLVSRFLGSSKRPFHFLHRFFYIQSDHIFSELNLLDTLERTLLPNFMTVTEKKKVKMWKWKWKLKNYDAVENMWKRKHTLFAPILHPWPNFLPPKRRR